jgi:hypothetical protein
VRAGGLEDGQRLRSDSTVIKAAIHEPTNSKLLIDSVRVLARLLREAREYVALQFTNHLKRAKRRQMAILTLVPTASSSISDRRALHRRSTVSDARTPATPSARDANSSIVTRSTMRRRAGSADLPDDLAEAEPYGGDMHGGVRAVMMISRYRSTWRGRGHAARPGFFRQRAARRRLLSVRSLGLLVAVLMSGCGPYPPATRCTYSFSPGRCMDQANQSDKPLAQQALPAEKLDPPEPSPPLPAPGQPTPCAAPDVLAAAVADQVHGAPVCAGFKVTLRAGGEVDVTAEHADLAGCLHDPEVHAALAELARCQPASRAD